VNKKSSRRSAMTMRFSDEGAAQVLPGAMLGRVSGVFRVPAGKLARSSKRTVPPRAVPSLSELGEERRWWRRWFTRRA
jgi:hypothetical protein